MKLNHNFIVHNTGDETLLVPTAEAPFHGLIQGNKTLEFILNCLQEDTTEEEIIGAISAEFRGNADEIREDVEKTVSELRRIGALDE